MITENSLLRDIIRVLESDSEVADRYSKKLEDLRQKKIIAQSHTYKVGVIGVTSSGKSTMINAIMKNDLLPTGVHPSSSQLVTCSKSKNNDDTVTVYFEETAPEIYKNKEAAKALKNYGDEKYNPENRWGVKQIEISTPGYLFPEEVILVDSPGLDAYGYDNHEALTLEVLLPVIDFCIFVTTCKYDKPLIIVQNMIDSVSPELKKDKTVKKTVDQVLKEHRGRLMRVVKASNVKEKENIRIVQVSARMALKGYTKKRSADIRKSNFESFLGAIREIFNIVRPRIEADRFDNIREPLIKCLSPSERAKSMTNIFTHLRFFDQNRAYIRLFQPIFSPYFPQKGALIPPLSPSVFLLRHTLADLHSQKAHSVCGNSLLFLDNVPL